MDPSKLLYAPSHEWVSIDGTTAIVGISKFAVDQLTDLLMIELPAVGSTLTAGKSFGEIESVKAVSDLYAPISGEVTEVNAAVADDVSLLADDPYTKGWLLKLKLTGTPDVSGLLDQKAYEEKVASEDH